MKMIRSGLLLLNMLLLLLLLPGADHAQGRYWYLMLVQRSQIILVGLGLHVRTLAFIFLQLSRAASSIVIGSLLVLGYV